MSQSPRTRVVRRTLAALGAGAVASALALAPLAPAYAHEDDEQRMLEMRAQYRSGVDVPVLTSPNVHLQASFPDTSAISGVFARSGRFFYVSSLHSISIYDVSNPLQPQLRGVLDNLTFENEAMNYGEKKLPDGSVRRFVLVGVDLHQASTEDPQHYNAGDGNEVIVVDVTDPDDPFIRSRTTTTTSSHTVACVNVSGCNYAYTAGSSSGYSILDLTNLNQPREVDSKAGTAGVQPFASPAVGLNPQAGFRAGHKWNFDNAGYGIHTGTGGTAVFDVTKPRQPRLVTTSGSQGVAPGWNDFIHHNSARPNATAFSPGAPASVGNGNVVLITEEDYENTDCATAGSFQTWKLTKLDGTAGAVRQLDKINPVTEGGGGFSPPVNAFCSAHWFDYHPAGIVALASYAGGLRLIDVRAAGNLKQYGYATFAVSEVWDAYWVPQRNAAGVAGAGKTNIVYTVDLVRGLDVYTVDLPGRTGRSAAVDASSGLVGGLRLPLDASAGLVVLGALATAGVLRRRLALRGASVG